MTEERVRRAIATIRARHRRSPYAHSPDCDGCRELWPCETSQLLATHERVDALAREITAALARG